MSNDPDAIRAQIEATREELGDTVEALAAKTDVKAQARRRLDETKASLADKKAELLVKKNELVAKARESSPEGARTTATRVSEQAQQRTRENQPQVPAAAAFVVGFLVGRVSRR